MGVAGRWAAAFCILVVSTVSALAQEPDGTRVALVIGNGAYEAVTPLANPVNDAEAVGAAFERVGFDVTLVTDLNQADMRHALQEFELKVATADVAVVYYAGHGIEVGGTNYLIPVDAELQRDTHVLDEAVSLDRVMVAINQADALRLVILDACRDNPFIESMEMTGGDRAVSRGLARVDLTGSTMVVFATREGTTADDGDGDHSPFTFALLSHLETPGLEVGFIFRHVRDDVMDATGGLQEPVWDASLGREPIYFVQALVNPGLNPQTVAANVPDPGDAASAYRDTLAINTVEAWSAFLRYHTTGLYADLARAALNKLLADGEGVAGELVETAEEDGPALGDVPVFVSPGDVAVAPADEGGALPEPDAADDNALEVAAPAEAADAAAEPGGGAPPEAVAEAEPPPPVPAAEPPAAAPIADVDEDALAAAALCDSYAAYALDPDLPEGIEPVGDLFLGSNVRPALEACRAAVEANPGDRRQLFQLARTAFMASRTDEAFETATAAAELGSAAAMAIVGLYHEYGLTVAQSYEAAVEWYQRSADGGSSDGMLFLGYLYEDGLGVPIDLEEAGRLYAAAVDLGNGGAMSAIGFRYDVGLGVEQDLAAAREWYQRAAEAEDSYAMNALGAMHEYGDGGPVDYVEARFWYEQAAAYGVGASMTSLGYFYEVGLGVEVDLEQAREWYESGASAGDHVAMFALGRFYESGIGVEVDYEESLNWYSQSALTGEMPYALIRLGNFFDQGLGVEQDFDTARDLFEEAAFAGEADAFLFLGFLYEFGRGVDLDLVRASDYYIDALSQGSPLALDEFLNYAGEYPPEILLRIETYLVSQGLLTGKADGVFDNATFQALRQLGAV